MATARQEVVINALPIKVWSLLGDVTKWPGWNQHITQGRMLEGDTFYPGSTFQYVYNGKPMVGTITLIDRPKALAWRAGNMRQTMRLEPVGNQTKVVAEYEVTGFMTSLRKGKAEAEASQACNDWLKSLKEGVERAG
ncbi:MAG: SRPBCC family protein [Anaerolineae bacterium]